MAQQTVTLQPGESKQVSFEATPNVAKTYQVSVDGLSGSFRALAVPDIALFDLLLVHSINGHGFSEVGADPYCGWCTACRGTGKYCIINPFTGEFACTTLPCPVCGGGTAFAVLSEPIILTKHQGFTLHFTYTGPTESTYTYNGLFFNLWHMTPGNPGSFGPPGYRGRFMAPLGVQTSPGFYRWQPSPWSGSVNINDCFAPDYYYKRACDLRIQVGLQFYDQAYAGQQIGNFWVKNAVRYV